MLSINTNANSLFAQNSLSGAQNSLAASVQRLSSGLCVNKGSDDAAGLAISKELQAQLRGINQSIQNLSNATNVLQTADAGLATVQDLMLRMEQLAVAGNNASLNSSQKSDLANELKDLLDEINATASRTQFNGIHLLDNGFSKFSAAPIQMPTLISSDGQPGSSSPGVTETAALTFSNLAAGQSVSLAGLTFTATGAVSANQVASAFASLANGATTGAGAGYGSYSGTLSNWTTGAASGTGVTFTSTTADANVSDLTTPAVSIVSGQPGSSSPGVTETAALTLGHQLTYFNGNPSSSKISFIGDLQAGDIFNIGGWWDSNSNTYNGGLSFTATALVTGADMANM